MERRGIIYRGKKKREAGRERKTGDGSTSLKDMKANREVFEYKMSLRTIKPSRTDGVYLPEGVKEEFSTAAGRKVT